MKIISIALAIFVSALSSFAQGTLVYDQQATLGNVARGGSYIQNQQPMGQSFTPSLSTVGFVQFMFDNIGGAVGASVSVNLLANSITGNVVSATSSAFIQNNFNGIATFFFPSNILIQSGVEYFFLPVLVSGDNISAAQFLFCKFVEHQTEGGFGFSMLR